MNWFNYIGLIIIVVIMVPNIIYGICGKSFYNKYKNKAAEIFEQIGRFGCFIFMIFNIPYTYFNFWFDNALLAYIITNSVLCLAYIVCWFIFWKKQNKAKALFLSILPSTIFVFSGIMLLNLPLIVFGVVFSVCHILISYKNAV